MTFSLPVCIYLIARQNTLCQILQLAYVEISVSKLDKGYITFNRLIIKFLQKMSLANYIYWLLNNDMLLLHESLVLIFIKIKLLPKTDSCSSGNVKRNRCCYSKDVIELCNQIYNMSIHSWALFILTECYT